MTLSEKDKMIELIRSVVRDELQKLMTEKDDDCVNNVKTTTTISYEKAKKYLNKITPEFSGYMNDSEISEIAFFMKAVFTAYEINYVIIHLVKDTFTETNGIKLYRKIYNK